MSEYTDTDLAAIANSIMRSDPRAVSVAFTHRADYVIVARTEAHETEAAVYCLPPTVERDDAGTILPQKLQLAAPTPESTSLDVVGEMEVRAVFDRPTRPRRAHRPRRSVVVSRRATRRQS